MKNSYLKKFVLLITVVSMMACLLNGCVSNHSGINYDGIKINMDKSDNAIQNLNLAVQSEISTLNPYMETTSSILKVMTNIYDILVTTDTDGNVAPAIAESWESNEDCTEWTFHLRHDSYWVNYRGEIQDTVKSDDFVTGLEWVSNYAKNSGNGFLMPQDYIKGAREYYEYTMELEEEEARNIPREKFLEMVGIETPDEWTVVYHTIDSCPFFLSLVQNIDFIPASEKHIEEIGIDGFIKSSIYDAWFNGPYVMTEFIPDNEKILDANPHWYGNDMHERFKSVTMRYVSDSSIQYQLYKTGELDYVELYSSQIKSIYSNENNEYHDMLVKSLPSRYMYQILFNFHKNKEDGTEDVDWNKAVANKAFRKSWRYGYNLYSSLKSADSIDPYSIESNSASPAGFVHLSDGTDYQALVISKQTDLKEYTGNSLRRFDEELFEKYKKQAIEELTAMGVKFPIKLETYVHASSQEDLDSAMVSKDAIEKSFGSDYIQVDIKTYTSSYYREVYLPRKYSYYISSWGPDFADPSSVLSQFLIGSENAYFMEYYYNIDDYTKEDLEGEHSYMKEVVDDFTTYKEMYNKAFSICNDMDERYKAFADAEYYLIENVLTLPLYGDRGWTLSKMDLTGKANSVSFLARERLVDIKTDKNGFDNSIWEGVDD